MVRLTFIRNSFKFSFSISKLCNSIFKSNLIIKICFIIVLVLFDLLPKNHNRFLAVTALEKSCGEYHSNGLKSKGIFELDRSLVNRLNRYNETLVCIYKFIASKNEKVMLSFSSFEVKSQAPDCINEYIDTYIEVKEETLNNYVETNFLSRWCGWKKPQILVSYHNIIVIAFHTDGRNKDTYFKGTYEFINADIYNFGKKSKTSCEYEFRSDDAKSGMFLSPTYPGTYPNILNCSYRFIGKPYERVQIDFEEILIHFGADHCPYDIIKLYDFQKILQNRTDNRKIQPDLIHHNDASYKKVLFESYCGRKLNFTVYSSFNIFEIEFEMSDSLGNEEYSEDENKILLRKGFKAFFKFSDQLANISFITGTHVTGTNCDQRITSINPNGFIYSPNYFSIKPINASCKYIFDGLNDSHNLEYIKLNFYLIDVKQSTSKNICNDNSVSHFIVYGSDRTKSKYCFNRLSTEPKELKSLGSHMTLIFNSVNVDEYTPANFKASYNFYTEFGIEGTRMYRNRTCLFLYNSQSVMYGNINSPRYPQNYPLNIRCTYIFDINPNKERILFTFRDFKLDGLSDKKNCSKYIDNLSIYQTKHYPEIFSYGNRYDKTEKDFKHSWTLLNRYCGFNMPSPIISDENAKKVVFTFYSDNVNYAQGFSASYDYMVLRECTNKYFADENNANGQIIIDKRYQSNYYCDWYINSSPDKMMLLSFKNEYLNDPKLNQFVIRIYDMNENMLKTNQIIRDQSADYVNESVEERENSSNLKNVFLPKYEYTLDNTVKHFQIDSSFIKIQLVFGKSMEFDDGRLLISWVSASKSINGRCKPYEFMCNQTKYCINSSLYCDGVEHCPNDFSDEPDKSYIQLTTFISSIILLLMFLSICLICRLRSNRNSKTKPDMPLNTNPNPLIYYKYSPANTNSSHSIDYLEAAITSV